MSRTRVRPNSKGTIEVVKAENGTFSLYLDKRLDRSNISERYLVDELCVRFGYCGEEFKAILRKLNESGRASLSAGSIA